MPYRNSTQILSEVLELTLENVTQSVLKRKANLPTGRLAGFLGKLIEADLIVKIEYKRKRTWIITERGRLYLEAYKKFISFAASYGFNL